MNIGKRISISMATDGGAVNILITGKRHMVLLHVGDKPKVLRFRIGGAA